MRGFDDWLEGFQKACDAIPKDEPETSELENAARPKVGFHAVVDVKEQMEKHLLTLPRMAYRTYRLAPGLGYEPRPSTRVLLEVLRWRCLLSESALAQNLETPLRNLAQEARTALQNMRPDPGLLLCTVQVEYDLLNSQYRISVIAGSGPGIPTGEMWPLPEPWADRTRRYPHDIKIPTPAYTDFVASALAEYLHRRSNS